VEEVATVEAARPAPVVFAHVASHVRTAAILLHKRRTVRTGANLDARLFFAPVVEVVDVLALALITVVRLPALAAYSVLAFGAFEEAGVFLSCE
jgi:hypothetical protein